MSVILQPQVSFPIVRQIANHLDETTYYVQAVVRGASGAVIDTVNLASQGSQRYQTSWQVPADPSGQGRYISIVTSVYTDSGYTTKSQSYGDEETTYLIFDRVMPAMRGGGGLDSRTTRRIISEEIAKIEFPEQKEVKIPQVKDYEAKLATLETNIGYIADLVEKLPKEQTSIQPILNGLQSVAQMIAEKEVTPQTDLSPVIEQMQKFETSLQMAVDAIMGTVEELGSTIPESLKVDLMNKLSEIVKSASFTIEPTKASMNAPEAPKEQPIPFDINQLAQ